jgi:hypothetical protein
VKIVENRRTYSITNLIYVPTLLSSNKGKKVKLWLVSEKGSFGKIRFIKTKWQETFVAKINLRNYGNYK